MATYSNSVDSPAVNTALGAPTLANSDTIRFIDFATVFTSALDFLSTVTGLTVEATPGFTGNMGTRNDGSLELDAAAAVRVRFGGREWRMTGVATALVFGPARADAELILDAFDATNTDIERGVVTANGTSDLGTVTISGQGAPASLNVQAGATAVTAVNAGPASVVRSRRNITNAQVFAGGVVECLDGARVTGTVTLSGGRYLQAGAGGNVTVAVGAAGGEIDLSRVNTAMTLTVTGRGRPPTVTVPAAGLVTIDASGFNGTPIMAVPVPL